MKTTGDKRVLKGDKRVLNAILRKICNENDVDINNVFISEFGYIKTVDLNKKDVDFCSTIYKGVEYHVSYVSGCFYPFILQAKK